MNFHKKIHILCYSVPKSNYDNHLEGQAQEFYQPCSRMLLQFPLSHQRISMRKKCENAEYLQLFRGEPKKLLIHNVYTIDGKTAKFVRIKYAFDSGRATREIQTDIEVFCYTSSIFGCHLFLTFRQLMIRINPPDAFHIGINGDSAIFFLRAEWLEYEVACQPVIEVPSIEITSIQPNKS